MGFRKLMNDFLLSRPLLSSVALAKEGFLSFNLLALLAPPAGPLEVRGWRL